MSKVLIAYFSHDGECYMEGAIKTIERGNTAVMADKIHALLPDADIFRIETVKPYPASYAECVKQAEKECNTNARPELKSKVADMDQYDTVILGYPCWHGTMPMAVCTFLGSYNMRGKTIIPFCTNEGSGMGRSEADIKKLCRGSKIKDGTAMHGTTVAKADAEAESIAYMAR
jgi:flavodoxin